MNTKESGSPPHPYSALCSLPISSASLVQSICHSGFTNLRQIYKFNILILILANQLLLILKNSCWFVCLVLFLMKSNCLCGEKKGNLFFLKLINTFLGCP